MKDERKYKKVLGKVIGWVAKNIDKLDTISDLIKILSTKSEDEVVSFSLKVEYTTEAGNSYTLNLPKTKVKDSNDIANTVASLLVASATDLGGIITEVEKYERKETIYKKKDSKTKEVVEDTDESI